MTERQNRRIGDYEILEVLGSGGMGQVFKVRNLISDRIEAMKIILPDLAGRQDLADRFLREIKLLAGLHHPNIAALRTALTVDNQLLMIMEYVEGTTVAARLEQGPLPVPDAVNYTGQVLGALSYAHQNNIIHRDIKPSNMMVTPEGVVKLMDFGIARSGDTSDLTATGAALGSLYYMPPEQAKGQATDARSDLYSVGASLYEMVTGERPFKADSSYSLMAAHVQQPPKPPIELRSNLPGTLNEIILLAMAKEPGQRFQTADAFRNALKSVPSEAPAAAIAGETRASSFATVPPVRIGEGVARTESPLFSEPLAVPPQVPGVLEMSRQQRNNKGKYMALGALLVVACLVVAGIYIPRRGGTHAGGNAVQQEQKAGAPGAANAPVDASNAQPAAGSFAEPENHANGTEGEVVQTVAEHIKNAARKSKIPAAESEPGTVAENPLPDNSAALADLEQQVDQLSGRAVAVNDSLDNLRRQMGSQGLGLRGDIAAAQERMKIHLEKAQAAVQSRDAENVKKHAAQAETELEQLERFLGR
jgi:serine/threonine-protein kinase